MNQFELNQYENAMRNAAGGTPAQRPPPQPPPRNPIRLFIGGGFFGLLLVVSTIIWACGANNPDTPAGYVGYVYRGALVGKTAYLGTQTGPTSWGLSWMTHAINVSVTPTTISEGFNTGSEVLSADGLKVTFQIHTLFKVRPDGVKDLVEHFSTLHESGKNNVEVVAFQQFVTEPLRTEARALAEVYKAREMPMHFTEMSQQLTEWLRNYTKATPFEILNVVAGNLQYPQEVANAVALKLATQQTLEQKSTEVEIAKKDAEKRVVEAEGVAKAMNIIQQKLTPLYIQHEAIEAQKLMVNSPNHTTIYVPVGSMGVPLVNPVRGE